jgi:shikimate kinase
MYLSFIGMSGVGKSHWAKELASNGWLHLDCDAMIADRLGEIIKVHSDEDSVHAVGRWMGMPWDEGYASREARYLELEILTTNRAIDQLYMHTTDSVVLDTTGSVVYTDSDTLNKLKRKTRVVYFEALESVRDDMVQQYLHEPKPVLWQGGYEPRPGEPRLDALARCYTDLLRDRTQRYRELADVVIDHHAVRQPGFTMDQFLSLIT